MAEEIQNHCIDSDLCTHQVHVLCLHMAPNIHYLMRILMQQYKTRKSVPCKWNV